MKRGGLSNDVPMVADAADRVLFCICCKMESFVVDEEMSFDAHVCRITCRRIGPSLASLGKIPTMISAFTCAAL